MYPLDRIRAADDISFTLDALGAFTPESDLCSLTGMCATGLNLSRSQMPQLETKPLAEADNPQALLDAGANPHDPLPILEQFLASLKAAGVWVVEGRIPVGKLRPCQGEIQAQKAEGMLQNHLAGEFDNIDDPILVSKDGFILDGHHRWAALLLLSPEAEIRVRVVDLLITDLLDRALSFPGVFRASFLGNRVARATRIPGVIQRFEDNAGWNLGLQATWRLFFNHLYADVDWLVKTRAIPPGMAKKFEMAARLFMKGSAKRPPLDMVAWWKKNEELVRLLEAASYWPERTEGGEDIFRVGLFRVHNTIQATGANLEGVREVLDRAQKFCHGQFARVCYGDVFVVGQLRQAKTLAWYSVTEDNVYVRLMKTSENSVSNLLHELGHRYWYKFVKDQTPWKDSFRRWSNPAQTKAPEVGDILPPELGLKGDPHIVSLEGMRVHLSTGGFVNWMQLYKALQDLSRRKSFPTLYAATSVEECFAECFDHYLRGILKEPFLSKFEETCTG